VTERDAPSADRTQRQALVAVHARGIDSRFRGFLPVVVDLETGGLDATQSAILELAYSIPERAPDGRWRAGPVRDFQIAPFSGAVISDASLKLTGINLDDPRRAPQSEAKVFATLQADIAHALTVTGCKRAILVGHNTHFDLHFLLAMGRRLGVSESPFHPFCVLDTVTLGVLLYGHTVLARCVPAAGLEFVNRDAHSAAYDCLKTSELFVAVLNQYGALLLDGGTRASACAKRKN
jgi:ribonuclease T